MTVCWATHPLHLSISITKDIPEHSPFRGKGLNTVLVRQACIFFTLTVCNKDNFDLLCLLDYMYSVSFLCGFVCVCVFFIKPEYEQHFMEHCLCHNVNHLGFQVCHIRLKIYLKIISLHV